MDYPNNFDIPDFPAGKTVAFSRSMSVWIFITFFFIVALCTFTLLMRHFTTNYPFLISVDSFTDDWSVVAFPKEKTEGIQKYRFIQEKLVNDYIQSWFTISKYNELNEKRWQKCSVAECSEPEQFNPDNVTCAISCKSSSEVFTEFSSNVVPQYRAMIEQASERWRVNRKQILPIFVNENGGKWRVYINIVSDVMGQFMVVAFIDIARDVASYPATFGYYIKQLNSYRITQ